MPSSPALGQPPERKHSLSELDLDSLSFTDATLANQQPPTPRYIIVSWADALVAQGHGWDPRIYSDPLPSASSTPHPQHLYDQYPNATLAPPTPSIDTEGRDARTLCPPAPPSRDVHMHMYTLADSPEELPPGTHSSSSILLHDPFPHHPNAGTGSWFASRGGTPTGDRSYDVEFYSSAPSSPRPPDTLGVVDTETHRTRPAIALDPTQPLRVDGKPRERVYAACERCRVRKLRCDGAQPTCYNCQRAAEKTHHTHHSSKARGGGAAAKVQCVYPAGPPKRRGADKAQRIRSPIGQRRPRSSMAKSSESGKGKEREREGTVSASESANDIDGGEVSGPSLPGTPDE